MASIDWTPVEEAEQEKTLAGYRLALLESAKIMEQRLVEERVPGSSAADRFTAAKLHFTRPKQIEQAYAYAESLRAGQTGSLTVERAKEYLQYFRQAVADLNDLAQSRDSLGAKLKLYLGLLKGRQRWLLNILIGVGGFFIGVLILADTPPGQLLVLGVVGVVHLFFKLIIGLLVFIALLLLAALGTAIYLDKRGRGVVRTEAEHHDRH